MTLRELSGHEGYTEAHWFPDGEHLLLIRGAAEPSNDTLTVTDRLGRLNIRTRNSQRLPFYAADRLYLIAGGTLYSMRTDGLYASRVLPDTYRAYTHVSPDGRWLFSLEGALLDENFQEVLNVFEAAGYDGADGAISGTHWNGGDLLLVTGGPVNGQIYSHVLEIELDSRTLTIIDESPTADWDELGDTFPNGDLFIRRSNHSKGQLVYQRCTRELDCTTLAALTDGGRFLDIALSKDGLYYGGLGLEPGFDIESAGPGAVVGLIDGSWEEMVNASDYYYEWSPTRNELALITTGAPGKLYPLLLLIE